MDAPSSMPPMSVRCGVQSEVHDSIAYDIKPTPLTQPTIQYDVKDPTPTTAQQQHSPSQHIVQHTPTKTQASGWSCTGSHTHNVHACTVSTASSGSGGSASSNAAGRNRQRVKPEGSGPGRPLTADRRRPYPCDLCPSRFGSKMELEEHQNSHTGEKPFECDICSARFNRRSTLWNHKRIHSDTKPFTCPICLMTFKWKNSLKCHKEMHERKNESPADMGAPPFDQEITYATARRQRGAVDDTITNVAAAISHEVNALKAANGGQLPISLTQSGKPSPNKHNNHNGGNPGGGTPKKRTRPTPGGRHAQKSQMNGVKGEPSVGGVIARAHTHAVQSPSGVYQHKENNVTVMMTAQNIYDNQQLLNNLAGFDTLTQHEHHQSLLHQSAQHMQHAAQSLADSIVQPFSQSFLSQAAGIGNHMPVSMFVSPNVTHQSLSESLNAMYGGGAIEQISSGHQPQVVYTQSMQALPLPNFTGGMDYTPNVDLAASSFIPFYSPQTHQMHQYTSGTATMAQQQQQHQQQQQQLHNNAQAMQSNFDAAAQAAYVQRVVHPSEY